MQRWCLRGTEQTPRVEGQEGGSSEGGKEGGVGWGDALDIPFYFQRYRP